MRLRPILPPSLALALVLALAQALTYEELAKPSCVHHGTDVAYFTESIELAYLDVAAAKLNELSDLGLLPDATRKSLTRMLRRASHGLCSPGNHREKRQLAAVAFLLGTVGSYLIGPAIRAMLQLNNPGHNDQWDKYITDSRRAIDWTRRRVDVLTNRVDADEVTVAILAALVAENEQWTDLLLGSDYLKDVLLYTEEQYRAINDSHQHIDDIYGKEHGIGSFVDLKHGLAIPPEAFSLKIHGFKGNSCNESHIHLETFAIVPSTTCEKIHHETDTVTVTIASETPTKYRVLGPLTSSFPVGPGKRLIPGENYLTTHPLDTLNMTFSSYQGSLWATPNQEGSALVVCGNEVYKHKLQPGFIYSVPLSCSASYGAPTAAPGSPYHASQSIVTPAGGKMTGGWHILRRAKTIIYQPTTALTKSVTTEPAPTLGQTTDYTSDWNSATPWLKILAGFGISAFLAASITMLIHKFRNKKNNYVVSIKKQSIDHEAYEPYLCPRTMSDDPDDNDFDSDDFTEMNYGNLDHEDIQRRPLPGIPSTPTGVVYEEMELVSMSASDQEDNYDHLILPAAPATPTSDAEHN